MWDGLDSEWNNEDIIGTYYTCKNSFPFLLMNTYIFGQTKTT